MCGGNGQWMGNDQQQMHHQQMLMQQQMLMAQMNGFGGTVVEWNDAKERFVVEIDGSMKHMLLRASNLERDRRERWAPEMHTAANLAHIQAEQERYLNEQAQENPFTQMFGKENADMLMKQQADKERQTQDPPRPGMWWSSFPFRGGPSLCRLFKPRVKTAPMRQTERRRVPCLLSSRSGPTSCIYSHNHLCALA